MFDDLSSEESEVPSLDFSPGAEVPLSGSAGQTAATQALASAAYRDGPVSDLLAANEESGFKAARFSLFEPNLGEAFARAVQVRLLGGARKPVIQSFGTEPQTVVEHCLAATRIRKERDTRLTVVTAIFGLLFLPGSLLWLIFFQLRRTLSRINGKREKSLAVAKLAALSGAGGLAASVGAVVLAVLAALVVIAAVAAIQLPMTGLWLLYLLAMPVAPIVGWWIAKQVSERYAKSLRGHWDALLGGSGVGPKVPETVPQDPGDEGAERIRLSLAKLSAEQRSNIVFYAGPKGILGMGTRWGSWQLAEELVPSDPGREIDGFRSWDVVRAIHDQLRMLERGPLHTGGFPTPTVRHWVVTPIGEGAKEVSRTETDSETDAYRVKTFEIQRICNEQQFGSGNRHYLGTQFVLWDGQLVLTYLISVTVLHHTLRIEVTGNALGPVHRLFTTKPSPKTKTVSKSVKFWETKDVQLPLVSAAEVVRLAVRAPFTWFPAVLDYLGGKLTLPEPFGVRHTWAEKPWRHRFMADDALRAATPVLRVVHAAAIRVLDEHGCDTTQFGSGSKALSGSIPGAEPRKADNYDA
ncbi:hypothetical protein [Streptomyces oceani]|uniref:Uncharacterized protein n=1 Tax=Streptomyces oceani TaxID=1075402 RepID=A0A1E7JYH1_9ACTN|nr:hypothetical protein [Streptomyces oceani]OEU96711.1 hypothetical protein AN216_18925 [Streptomyces oceani]